MSSIFKNLKNRRKLIENILLDSRMYILKRRILSDGGGIKTEIFEYKGENYPARIQPIFRRPDGSDSNAVIEMTDLRLVYPAEVILSTSDRIQVNTRIYTIRNTYDNVDDAMTNQCYVAVIPNSVIFPPTLIE